MLKHIQRAKTATDTWLSVPALKYFLLCLLLFLLPTQLGLHFWPDWAFIDGIRIDYFSPTVYFTDVIITLIVTLNLPRRVGVPPKAVISGLVFILLSLTNIYFSILPQVTIYKWLKLLELFLLGKIMLENFSVSFIKYFSWGMVLQGAIVVTQLYLQSSIGGIFYFLGERNFTMATGGIAQFFFLDKLFLRPYGTLPHPNVLAGFLIIAVIVNKNIFFRLFCILVLILTTSRYVIIFFALVSFMSIAHKIFQKIFPREKVQIFLVNNVFTVILLVQVVLGMFWPILFPYVNLDNSFLIRQTLQKISIEAMPTYFLSGYGLGTDVFYHAKNYFYIYTSPLSYIQPTHNIFLMLLNEVGIFMFLFLVCFLLKVFLFTNLEGKFLIFTFVILGSFDHYFFTTQQGQLLTIFIFVLAIINKWRDIKPSAKTLLFN